MAQRLTGLDAAVLELESTRVPLHSLALWLLDPSTVPGGSSFEGLRDGFLNALDAAPRLRGRLAEVPFGLAPAKWVDARVDAALHVERAALPRPGGPRQLARLVAEVGERLLDRNRPLWHVTLVEGLASGSLAAIVKLHCVPMDGTWAADLAGQLAADAPEALPPLPDAAARPAVASGGSLERISEALPSVAAQPLRLARAGVRAAGALVQAGLDHDGGGGWITSPTPHPTLNRRSSARRSIAYSSLRGATIRSAAARHGVGWRDVVLAAVSAALRDHLEQSEGIPDDPLLAFVIDGTEDHDHARARAHGRLPRVSRRSLATQQRDPRTRLAEIASGAPHGHADADWPEALTGVLDAASPWMLRWLTAGVAAVRPRTGAAPPFHLLVSFLEGSDKPGFVAGARIEHVHPIHPILDGANLHVAVRRSGAALDVGIHACRRFLPDAWRLAAALDEAVAVLDSLAAPER